MANILALHLRMIEAIFLSWQYDLDMQNVTLHTSAMYSSENNVNIETALTNNGQRQYYVDK